MKWNQIVDKGNKKGCKELLKVGLGKNPLWILRTSQNKDRHFLGLPGRQMVDDSWPENYSMEATAKHLKVYTVTTERNHGNLLEGYKKALNKGKCFAQNLNLQSVFYQTEKHENKNRRIGCQPADYYLE